MSSKKRPGRSGVPRGSAPRKATAPARCAAVPPAPSLKQVAERMRGPTFLDALSPEERRAGVPEAMETSGGAGPRRPLWIVGERGVTGSAAGGHPR